MNLLTVGWKKLIILSNMFDRKEIVEVQMLNISSQKYGLKDLF